MLNQKIAAIANMHNIVSKLHARLASHVLSRRGRERKVWMGEKSEKAPANKLIPLTRVSHEPVFGRFDARI